MVDANTVIERAEERREQRQELLRPVAEFFHEHEGELFERYEAVDELTDELDVSDDDLLHQVIGNLAGDRVDPVQNVIEDGTKWIGVIDYDEHGFWYEYTEAHDVHGRTNVGVCAQCVQEAANDAQVAKGVGTTEELDQRVREHYEEEHADEPDEVETGATLVSGTTVAGNDPIHTGNIGTKSIDADTARGTERSGLVKPSTNYAQTTDKFAGQFISDSITFDFSGGVTDMASDSQQSVYTVDGTFGTAELRVHDHSGSLISTISTPSKVRGVDFNSNDSLWVTDDEQEKMTKLDGSGTYLSEVSLSNVISTSARCAGVDSNGCLYTLESSNGDESLYSFNQSGSTIAQTSLNYLGGVAVDIDDCVWIGQQSDDHLEVYNNSASLVTTTNAPVVSGIDMVAFVPWPDIFFNNTDSDSIMIKYRTKGIKYD